MPIHGLSHVTLLARDLDAMERMLVTILDARKVYDSGVQTFSLSPERFYLIGAGPAPVWLAVMHGEAPPRSYQHVAFKIDEGDFDDRLARVTALGLEIKPGRPRVEGEARSIYFYSPEGHLFELHTGALAERLDRYIAAAPTHARPVSPAPRIRAARVDDLPDLVAMIGALAAHHGDEARTSGERLLADAFGDEPWAHFLVARQDGAGEPLGYAALVRSYQAQFARRSVELHHLFVAPGARGVGVGRALMDAAANWARGRGAARLTVGTHPENAVARRYYETHGFADLPVAGGARMVLALE